MKIKFVYGVLPALVFYTDWFMKDWMSAMAIGPFVFVRKSWKTNEPLLTHELVHVKQFYRTLGLMGIFYKVSAKFRLRMEVEAYKAQLEKTPMHLYNTKLHSFAHVLSDHYNLNITKQEALAHLQKL